MLSSILTNVVATSHLLSIWNVANVTKELNFSFYVTLVTLHRQIMWLVATHAALFLDSAALFFT